MPDPAPERRLPTMVLGDPGDAVRVDRDFSRGQEWDLPVRQCPMWPEELARPRRDIDTPASSETPPETP